MVEKKFPEGMTPLDNNTFQFRCSPDVSCFTRCCRKLDLFLYPYDIIRLKNYLTISSETFLYKYVQVVRGNNPFFPSVMLKMMDTEEQTCPFLTSEGCVVYPDRPSSCRTYPLERAVDRNPQRGQLKEYYFLTDHPYCLGHAEQKDWTVREWVRDQQLHYYNLMDELWAEMDTLFRSNPWQGEGDGGPLQQLAFMVCYNVDGFRHYINEHQLLDQFKLSGSRKRDINAKDDELLKFGFEWLKYILAGIPTLKAR